MKLPLGASGQVVKAARQLVALHGEETVSYTHLDVYKRQVWGRSADGAVLLFVWHVGE